MIRSREREARAARTAGQRPRAITTIAVARAPSISTGGSNLIPVELSAMRASPSGAIGERRVATTTAPNAPTSPTTRLRGVPSTTN